MRTRASFHPLRIARVDRLCADAVAVTLDVPPELGETYTFRAGQYLTLRTEVDGREERRSYSICAPEGAAPRIGVRRVDGGLFSEHLVNAARPGDLVEALAPQGRFVPPEGTGLHHGFIAAGSGITPVLSIASTVLAGDPHARVSLLYGNRGTPTVMFADELADLKDAYPERLHLVHVLSREAGEAELLCGRLDAERITALLDRVVDAEHVDHWWLCGPHGMITDAEKVLASRAVSSERVHRELFYVDTPPEPPHRVDPDAGAPTTATIVLDGKASTVGVPRETTILDAAQRARSDVPFACKGGVCGTCRAKVTEGSVRMRGNYALEQHEIDAGFVLTCQSVPTSDTVAVDYDA